MSQPAPPGRRSFWQWYRAQTRFARIGLGCASLFVVLLLCTGGLAAYGSTLPPPPKTAQSPTSIPTKAPTQAIVLTTVPTTPPTATRVPTATPTMKPTPTPATVPGNLTPTYGTPRLGGPITDFIGKYGKPDTGCATCASGIYNFQRYQGTGIDYISTMLTDANGHTYAFDVQAPPNSDWDASTAKALCESFGPSDVNYDHPVQVLQSSDGVIVEKVYKSTWLAGQLDASDFQDGNTMTGNINLPAGTFDISFSYSGGPSKVSDCVLAAGIERV
jgi:hypothetical protein